MIVKNEAPVIRRCLESVRPIIGYWVIVDTGSTDGTQDIIRAHLKDVPGELHERPWRDFAHNRSEALTLAQPHGDYSLIIDADDALEIPGGYRLPELTADSYTLDIQDTSIRYQRTQIVRNSLPWCYRGVLHEFLTCDGSGPGGHLPIVMRRNHDGARRRDPMTYRNDAAILEAALLTETDPFLRSRYTFYLAQSYRDCGEKQKAVEAYLRRADLGFWDQEVFCGLYKAAQIKEELGHTPEEIVALCLRASDAAPNRAEALHCASRLCRNTSRNQQGYEIAKRGLALTAPSDGLFVETWIYDYGLLDEFVVNAYWSGHYDECLDACVRLLARDTLPDGYRDRIAANARFALDKMPKPNAPSSLDVLVWPAGSGVPDVPPAPPAIARSRGAPGVAPGLVSVITPTRGREDFLKQALTCFRGQDYPNIEWLILDDSPRASEFFSDLSAGDISYRHVDKRLSIGEKRNILIEQANGGIIVQFDDDDYYAPNYVSTMVSALAERDADLINLRGWFLYDVRSRFFGYWDLMRKVGPYYRCDATGVAVAILNSENNRILENNHLGYGFSYVYKRAVWEAVKFPEIDWNEDGEFTLAARSKFKVDGIHDTTGLCLHFFHPGSTSRCFPQYYLPKLLFRDIFPKLDIPGANEPADVTSPPHAHPALQSAGAAPGWTPERPMGGTELMVEGLWRRMGNELNAINLCINGYEEAHLDNRPLIVWMHHDCDQDVVQWIHDQNKVARVAWFVFVSEWQKSRYLDRFGIPSRKCFVLRNASEAGHSNRRWNPGKPLKFAYTSTPFRGLSVLLDAWGKLRPDDAELHIWSSMKLYGPELTDSAYEDLYDRAMASPNVAYHGIVPNEELRAALRDIDFLAYPSTFPETSCLSVIEAMAAGCRIICPSLGALPETTGTFARLYPYPTDPAAHADLFRDILAEEIRNPWEGHPERAEEQQNFARETYDWAARVAEWRKFIRMALEPARRTAV